MDFIQDRRTGTFVCLEANTLPGMTPMSLLPQEARAAGISVVHQEIKLAEPLSVAENMFLGNVMMKGHLVDKEANREAVKKFLYSED